MYHGHQGSDHSGRVGVLYHVSPIDDPRGALLNQSFRSLQDLFVGGPASSSNEHGDAGDADDLVVNRDIIGGVCLDDVGSHFHCLAHEGQNLVRIAIHHITSRLLIRLENERLDHEGHSIPIALGLDTEDVLDALIGQFGLVGNSEEVHDHTGRVESKRLFHRRLDHAAEEVLGQFPAIDVGDVRSKNQRGLEAARNGLEEVGLADGELDGIGCGLDYRLHGRVEVLDAREEPKLVEEPVINRHVEATATLGIEESVEAIGLHSGATIREHTLDVAEPSLVLIGGASHTGKSTLARAITDHIGWELVHTDKLARHPGRPWSFPGFDLPPHVPVYYREHSPADLLADVLEHYGRVWKLVEALPAPVLPGRVLEGSAILPEHALPLVRAGSIGIWLCADPQILEDRIRAESEYAQRNPEERAAIDGFQARNGLMNAHIERSARALGLPIYDAREPTSSLLERVLALAQG